MYERSICPNAALVAKPTAGASPAYQEILTSPTYSQLPYASVSVAFPAGFGGGLFVT
ncbi:hypothetical protein Hsw_3256 [Hymenobacter swuensis DY53]|uniref:Uncharacterized protein n=1 Tax=Hymenobacter swuensis DY53 TaxID=1227739 RepID=W8F8A0_9BACT|nr:hypothetical protein Hsw_3256 [Hymenobacter swuensis DY53]